MPEKEFTVLQDRLDDVERSLRTLQARIDMLEGVSPVAAPAPPAPAAAQKEQSLIDATLIGKSVLIVGGGYVLRAMTELNLLPNAFGVAFGLLYALFWIGIAGRALRRGSAAVAIFDGATAAVIAASLIWEATTRFHLINTTAAGAMIVAVAIALLVPAVRNSSTAFALIAAVASSLASIGVALGSEDPIPSLLAVTAIGVLLLSLSIGRHWPAYVTLLLPGAGHSLALTVIAMTLFDKLAYSTATTELSLMVFAALWLAVPIVLRLRNAEMPWPALAQSIAAVLVGCGGAAAIAFHGGHPLAVGVLSLFLSALSFVAVFARGERDVAANALIAAASLSAVIGLPLLVPTSALTFIAAMATILFAALGRSLRWPALTIASACWSIAAFAAGLESPVALVVVFTAAAMAIAITTPAASGSRLVLLVVSTMSLIVAAVSFVTFTQPLLALDRTVVLVVVAVGLSLLTPLLHDAGKIARVLLVLCGIKLLIEDLRLGHATTIVAALVLYGLAIVIVARRASPVKTPTL